MQLNKKVEAPKAYNNEGTRVPAIGPELELRRTVMACMLWEDSFYEGGVSVSDRIKALVPLCRPDWVAACAFHARTAMKLRHVPLLLVACMTFHEKHKALVGKLLPDVIQRVDEITEFMAVYQALGSKTLSAQVKIGLARAFKKFGEFDFAKYNRDKAWKLRDVLFLCHSKPGDAPERLNTKAERAAKKKLRLSAGESVYAKIVTNELTAPDTWEVALSGGADKRATFERLIGEKALGALALIRNLRGMVEAGVPDAVIRGALGTMKVERVLPFRFIAAARYAPRFEPELEAAMIRCLADAPKLAGKTAIVIDTSPSMWQAKVSAKSDMDRFEAAAALAILVREVCAEVAIYAFNERAYEVPPRRGFGLRDALAVTRGQASCGGLAVTLANQRGYDRIIVLTDGEWHYMDPSGRAIQRMGEAKAISPDPLTAKAYMINVSISKNGVGYGKWTSIDGWSEAVIEYIRQSENESKL